MKLIANECVQCGRPTGYVTPKAILIPTLCVVCCNDPETLQEWGHKIDPREKRPVDVLREVRSTLNRMDLK